MGHMRRGVLGGALLALLGLVTDPAGAQSSKCSSFKLKAAGGAVNQLLTCQAKAVKKHVAVNASCEPKSSAAFDALFLKADHKADCITAASGGTIWGGVDDFVARVTNAVTGNMTGPSSCDAKKLSAAGLKANAKANCAAKAVRKGRSTDATCLAKAETKFAASVAKAEARSDCTSRGQTTALEAIVDGYVSDLLAKLTSPASTTTTTLATGTTTTTLPPCSCCTATPLLAFTTRPPDVGSGTCDTSDGTITGTVQDDNAVTLCNLRSGGLYFGGAGVGIPLPAVVPDTGTYITKLINCKPATGVFDFAPTTDVDTGSGRNCTAAGVVNPEYPTRPGCLFGPPLPIPNPTSIATSTCVINRVTTSASGSGNCSDGSYALLDLPLGSDIYLTGDLLDGSAADRPDVAGIQPCPICTPGGTCSSGTCCKGGPRHDLDCVPGSTNLGAAYPTSHDCPPPGAGGNTSPFVGTLPIPYAVTTGSSSKVAADRSAQMFVFCGFCGQAFAPNFQGPPAHPCAADADCTTSPFTKCRQRTSGAFGQGPGRTITETGTAAGICLNSGAPYTATLVSAFCIPPTFNSTVDASADLPGPGAVSLPGQAQFMP